jgi:hypothetical protein
LAVDEVFFPSPDGRDDLIAGDVDDAFHLSA